jgi:uncharacterized membrane protein
MRAIDVPINSDQSGAKGGSLVQSLGAVNVGDTERWASAVGGGALVAYGLTQRAPTSALLALAGGYLLLRGASGHCFAYQALGISTASPQAGKIHVEKHVSINRPIGEVYQFWRNLENLPRFMKHLKEVRTLDAKRSHWVANAPLGASVEWDAEIIMEQTDELIAWRSLPEAQVPNAGSVRFRALPAGRGTEVTVILEYIPPAGAVGAAFAKLFSEEPSQQIEGDLRRLRSVLEAGEIPSVNGQPSGRGRQQTHEAEREGSWQAREMQQGGELKSKEVNR